MKVLFLGADDPYTTSAHRAEAIRRIGHEVTHLNPRSLLPNWKLIGGLITRVGFAPFSPFIDRVLKSKLREGSFDVAWLDTGAELGPGFHIWLKKRGIRIINYNVDDPFGERDGRKWNLYRKSVPYHDLTVVVRKENIEEAKAAGASKVLHVFRSYDPVAHSPANPTREEAEKWACDVSFIGTWMPERGPFMARLIQLGVPLTIRGKWWEKAPEWPVIKAAWKGPNVMGRDYVLSIQCSKVTLGLLSKGNRDLHTTRSAEVPFIGGAAFCAERTEEHLEMFNEGEEAIFWSNPEECAKQCFCLLGDESLRQKLVEAAKFRVTSSGYSNDQIILNIFKFL